MYSSLNYQFLCTQTVTVYHAEKDFFTRTIYNNAFLDYRKNQNIDKTGSTESNSFLLIIPGKDVKIQVGDKVLSGIGNEIQTSQEWAKFIPALVQGLVVVKYVDPKYYRGQLCHWEAGG